MLIPAGLWKFVSSGSGGWNPLGGWGQTWPPYCSSDQVSGPDHHIWWDNNLYRGRGRVQMLLVSKWTRYGQKCCDAISCDGCILKLVDKNPARHPSVLARSRSSGRQIMAGILRRQRCPDDAPNGGKVIPQRKEVTYCMFSWENQTQYCFEKNLDVKDEYCFPCAAPMLRRTQMRSIMANVAYDSS
jgi:hypothetical protein